MRRVLMDAMLSDAAVEAQLSDDNQLAAMLEVEIALVAELGLNLEGKGVK